MHANGRQSAGKAEDAGTEVRMPDDGAYLVRQLEVSATRADEVADG